MKDSYTNVGFAILLSLLVTACESGPKADLVLRGGKVVTVDADFSIEEAIAETRKALEEGGTERINKAVEDLTQASHKLAEVMYQSAQQAAGDAGPHQANGAEEQESKSDDDVIDAEYVDVEDKK